MKKKLLYISAIAVILICILFPVLSYIPSNAINDEISKGISELKIDFQEQALNQTELSYSSNPYDYVKDNNNYKQIVKLGYKAIPVIQRKLESSSDNGLVEYVLAIAAEEIAKTDLKVVLDGKYKYETAKGFSKEWENFADDLKSNINTILYEEKDTTNKNKKLEDLGIFAIPYIVDAYKNGDKELSDVIVSLSKKVPELQSENLQSNNVEQFIKDKNEIINELEASK